MRDDRRIDSWLEWCAVPTARFRMGSPLHTVNESAVDLGIPLQWLRKECPDHEVFVPEFSISRYLVTCEVMSLAAEDGAVQWQQTGPDTHPASVDHRQALAFCAWMSNRLDVLVRLPSEPEWELSARGMDGRVFPWGDRFDRDLANTRESGIGSTTPVGSFPLGRSPYGLLDVAGNLDEWTGTEYAPYPGAPPDVVAVETWALSPIVTRGGGFNHGRDAARCARRHGLYEPGPVGLRIATPE
jgi:formylglycine-generating enzyme required for sulfatase activity